MGSVIVAPCSLFTSGHSRPSDVQQFPLHGLRGSMESGAEPSRAGTVHASRIIDCLDCLLSASALNNNADCVPDRE